MKGKKHEKSNVAVKKKKNQTRGWNGGDKMSWKKPRKRVKSKAKVFTPES